MTRAQFILIFTTLVFGSACHAVELDYDRLFSVQLTATPRTNPYGIVLNWVPELYGNQGHSIFRKAKEGTSWTLLATLPADATSYTDLNVPVGQVWEYGVVRMHLLYPQYPLFAAFGYVLAGVQAPLTEARGKVIVLVDDTVATPLTIELNRLQTDLVGDGWQVVRQNVSRTAAVPAVRSQIQSIYNADPANTKALLLFGHVPVPYSGDIAPDGHDEHRGAWATDMYYADMTGTWTDTTVNISSALRIENRNVPGDGKFDQSELPAPLALQTGRVDLYGNPPFNMSEVELLRRYLNKDHDFRHKLVEPLRRGIVWDDFQSGIYAMPGFRNFSAFFGPQNITNERWLPRLETEHYLWAYSAGGGLMASCDGLGSVIDMATQDPKATFTMLYGSWFGDWDSEWNILRAQLCTSTGLTAAWGCSPNKYLHQMALGETIGYAMQKSQNNQFTHQYGFAQQNSEGGFITATLHGDPTLRLHPVAPPTPLGTSGNKIYWMPSPDSNLVGYHVYRAPSMSGPFKRLTGAPIQTTYFADDSAPAGVNIYMVRAIKLESSASGTYYNPSQGIFIKRVVDVTLASARMVAQAVPEAGQAVQFAAASEVSDLKWQWDFGDGASSSAGASVSHTFAAPGTYRVQVTAAAASAESEVSGAALSATQEFWVTINTAKSQPPVTPVEDAVLPLNVKVLQFAGTGTGPAAVQFKGTLPSSAKLAGQTLTLSIGGAAAAFEFDVKGRAHNAAGRLRANAKNGVLALTARLRLNGISGADGSVPVTADWAGMRYAANVTGVWSAKGAALKFKK